MNDQLVELTRCYDPGQAHIIRSFLESHEVPCFLFDEGINGLQWHMQLAYGGMRLMVLKTDLDEAQKLLDQQHQLSVSTDAQVEIIHPRWWEKVLQIGLFLITMIPLPWHKRRNRMRNDT